MFWSVDFLGQGANASDVYLPPELVCSDGLSDTREATCIPPCRFILPECQIEPTAVTATYTVTLGVYNEPSASSETTVTTTVTVHTDAVSFDPVYVGAGRTGGEIFNPIAIIPVPPITISITHQDGQVVPRTVPLPGYPRTGAWPLPEGRQPSSPDPWAQYVPPPSSTSLSSWASNQTSTATSTDSDLLPMGIIRPPRPPATVPLDLVFDPTPRPQTSEPPVTYPSLTESSSSTELIGPVLQTWPPKAVQLTDQKDDDDDDDDDWPCDVWFFVICIRWPKINIKWIHFPEPIPPGLYIWPPPPGVIDLPPGLTLDLKPTPVRTVTRGTDNKWTTPDQSEEKKTCTKRTTVYDTLVSVTETIRTTSRTRRVTTTSTVYTTRFPRVGCSVTKTATTTTGTTTVSCRAQNEAKPTREVIGVEKYSAVPTAWPKPIPQRATGDGIIDATSPLVEPRSSLHQKRAPCDIVNDYYLVIPWNPFDASLLDQLVENYRYRDGGAGPPMKLPYTKIAAPSHQGFTGGWFFEFITVELRSQFIESPYRQKVRFIGPVAGDRAENGGSGSTASPGSVKRGAAEDETSSSSRRRAARHDGSRKGLRDSGPGHNGTAQSLLRRALAQSKSWELSAISVPPKELWEDNKAWYNAATGIYNATYHASAGARQQVYMYDSGVPWLTHSEFAANPPELIGMAQYGGRVQAEQVQENHVSQMAARIVGRELGVAKHAKLWAIGTLDPGAETETTLLGVFRMMEAFVRILEHVASKGWGTSSVLTTSFGITPSAERQANPRDVLEALRGIIANVYVELASLGVVLVSAAGNNGNEAHPSSHFPNWIADPKVVEAATTLGAAKDWYNPSRDDRNLRYVAHMTKLKRVPHCMMVVGAVNRAMELSPLSDVADHVTVYAPGDGCWALSSPRARQNADTILPYEVTDDLGNIVYDRSKPDTPWMLKGTSLSSPIVGGLAAYFRGVAADDDGSLLSKKVVDPAMVKYLIVKLQRIVEFNAPSEKRQPTVWNAQVPRDDAGGPAIGDLSCLHRDDVARMTPRQKAWCPDVEDPRWWDDPEWWSDDKFTGSGGSDPSPDPGPGPPPGPPPGPGITWYHGDPGPQCRPTGRGLATLPRNLSPLPRLTGAGQCGIPCNLDWYCDWWPSGLPPFYYDPKDPNSPYYDLHKDAYPGSGVISPGGTQSAAPAGSSPQPTAGSGAQPTSVAPIATPRPSTLPAGFPTSPIGPIGLPGFLSKVETCAAAVYATVSSAVGATPPALGDFQVMVAGSPDLGRWAVRCHGPLSYPGYACDGGYGLDRVGRTNEDYMDATAHVPGGGRDIHFKMYKMANIDAAHNQPLDWIGLFEALFGGLLRHEGVSITLPRALLEKRVSTAIVFFGTNCPGFSFAQGRLDEDPKLAGKYRPL